MKNIFKTMVFLMAVILLDGCHDITTEGVTDITVYPVLTLNGDQFLTIPQGGTYSDPGGASATIGDEDVTKNIKISGTVNVNTPGVYIITYSVANSDGFVASTNRYIGVISAASATMDISGSYKRTDGGVFGPATVSATSYPGMYINSNPGGIADENQVIVYMFHPTPTMVCAPLQNTSVGPFECDMGTYKDQSPKVFSWRCLNAGYGTAIRTFTEQ